MAISDAQKIDFLYKKIGYGVAGTDSAQYKSPSNEQFASPLLIRGDNIWVNSSQIPFDPPAVTDSIVEVYTSTAAVRTTKDLTVRNNRAWLTGLNNWIGVEFGPQYQLKVYVDDAGATNPSVTGTRLYPDGSGSNDAWFFDYQSGILTFPDSNIPTAITAGKVIFVEGYRYVGAVGLPDSVANAAILESALTQLSSLLDGTPSTLDTLQEIANALGNDPNFVLTITGQIEAEESRATSAEANLQAQIDSIVLAQSETAANVSYNLDQEISRATAAESSLQTALTTAISTEHQHHVDGDATLQAAIAAEVTRATAAESSLQSAIDAEHQHHVDGDTTLQAAIDSEITRATAAETSLQAAIDAEITRAQTAESNLSSNLTSYIDTSISNVLGGAPELLDTLNELAAAIGDDPNFIGNISANLSAEITRASTIEANLQAQIDALSGSATSSLADEITRATAAESSLQTALTSAIDTEHQHHVDGDATLQAAIDAEITRATAAEANIVSYIDSTITNLVDGAPAILDTLKELADALGGDQNFVLTINNKIDTKANIADLANVAFTGSYNDLSNKPVETFVFNSSSVWSVVHNRGTRYFVESVFDSAGQKMIVPVNIIDNNSFEIVLTQATAGHVTVFFG